jgi:hypothetical protein
LQWGQQYQYRAIHSNACITDKDGIFWFGSQIMFLIAYENRENATHESQESTIKAFCLTTTFSGDLS